MASHFPGHTKASPAPHSVFCIPQVWSSPGTAPYPMVFPTFSATWHLHNDGPGAHCRSFWVHTSMPCSGAPLHRKQGCFPFTSFSGTLLPTATLVCIILSRQNHGTNCLPSWSVELSRHASTATLFFPIRILSARLRVTPRVCPFLASLEVNRLTLGLVQSLPKLEREMYPCHCG